MVFDLRDRIAIVTGAGRGIGKNIARKFAEAGARVILVDNDRVQGIRTEEELNRATNVSVEYAYCDLKDINEINELFQWVINKHGRADILVNNARAGVRTAPFNETDDNFQLTLDVSLRAPLFLSQLFIRSSIENGDSGCILNISSVAASNIGSESVSYHLAKAALENLTRYLAVHGGPFGIRANAIRPGFIVKDEHIERYEMESNKKYQRIFAYSHPSKKYGTSDDVANAALFLCSDFAEFITGEVLTIDGGLLRQDPFAVSSRICGL